MPQYVYTAMADIPVPGTDAAILATIENPADSGMLFAIIGLVEQESGNGHPPPMNIRRYTGTISTSLIDSAQIPVPYPHLVTSPSASGVVRTVASHAFTPPGDAPTFEGALEMLQAFPPTSPILVAPGETGALWSRDGGGDIPIMFALQWAEIPISFPVEHIASATLPAAGAYTSATYFDVPEDWSGLTFFLTYTAANATTTARPKWRVSASDGTNDFLVPIGDQTLDLGSPPAAAQDVFIHEQRWGAAVTANATIRTTVTVKVPPGVTQLRLDVAEHGQTAAPGTASVSVTGASQ